MAVGRYCVEKSFEEGENIFLQGDVADSYFIVTDGQVCSD